METKTSHSILERVKAAKDKEARDPTAEAFSTALQGMAAEQLRSDALKDVRNVGLTALGAGVAGRGLIGLIQSLRENKAKKTRSGPSYLPLPYPTKTAGFLEGDEASSKGGIPWYGPAMLLGGLGGLGAGWAGMDKLLDVEQRRRRKAEMDEAKQQFHDALMSQYSSPIATHPELNKKSADDTMVKVGEALTGLFSSFQKALFEKAALDWENLAGKATGGYGMYAGLSGLLTGAYVYDKIQKRSRRAILEKALQKRQRRNSMQAPTEIYAVPEGVPAEPGV